MLGKKPKIYGYVSGEEKGTLKKTARNDAYAVKRNCAIT
jgi:hypothetical protein